MKKLSAKQKILNYLSKQTGYNSLSVAQARARFGIVNVAARIEERHGLTVVAFSFSLA